MYINELVHILEGHGIKIKLFADDVKMCVKLFYKHDLKKTPIAAFDSLVKWAETWQLTITIEKSCVLNIKNIQNYTCLHMNTDVATVVNQVRHLGVIYSEWAMSYGLLHTLMQWLQKRISVQMPFTVHLCHVTQAYLSELFLCMLDRLWNIIRLYCRHILSKTSKPVLLFVCCIKELPAFHRF